MESHSASKSAIKEFERLGGSINIVKFEKVKKPKSNKTKNEENKKLDEETKQKVSKPGNIPKNKPEIIKKTGIKTKPESKIRIKLRLKRKPPQPQNQEVKSWHQYLNNLHQE